MPQTILHPMLGLVYIGGKESTNVQVRLIGLGKYQRINYG